MNRFKTHFVITLLAVMLPLISMAQSLTLDATPNPACQGTVVTFSTNASVIGQIQYHVLLKGDDTGIDTVETHSNTANFSITATETAVYKAKVIYGNNIKREVVSDPLTLTVNYGTHNVTTVTECESYTWTTGTGLTYTTSDTYVYEYDNESGCASADTLHLTINNGTHNVTTVTECESYTWTSGNGETYITSGTYYYDYDNESGCASADTLHLTINYGTHNVETVTECDSYTWASGTGLTYDTSGTYIYNYDNESGCASADTLHLTINNSYEYDEEPVATCDYYEWHDSIYYESGYYTYTTETVHGCDSIMHINLTINKAPEIELSGDDFICDNSESVYTLTTYPNNGLSYKWTVDGGTIATADTTETVTIIWNKNNTEGNVSVTVTNKTTGCYTNAAKSVQIQSFVSEDLNKIVAKKNSNGIPYVLIYPNPSNEYHYQWYRYNLPLEGETGQYLYLNDNTSNEIDSIYRVYVGYISDGNSLVCGKYSDYYINSQISAKGRMTISPNPVNHCEVFSIYMDNNNDNSLINIFSSEGNVVFKSEMAGNPIKIHAGFPKGIYIIELIDNHGDKHFGKVIIK